MIAFARTFDVEAEGNAAVHAPDPLPRPNRQDDAA